MELLLFEKIGIDSNDISKKVTTKFLYLAQDLPNQKLDFLREYRNSVLACNQLYYVSCSRAKNRVFIIR